MDKENCRLCLLGETKVTLELEQVPRNIQKLLRERDLDDDKPIRLDVKTCSRCGFVQISPLLDFAYYDDYLMATTHSNQMQMHQKKQAYDYVNRFELSGKKVLEVGCGDGSYLKYLKSAGAQVFGVEPSKRFRAIAIANGFNVEDSYLTSEKKIRSGPFDGFVTRQVLEHVPDIHGFLTGIRLNMNAGGYGLIEVPSLEKALLDRRYYDFFTDHVNYFSLRTLRLALTLNGFEVLDVYHDMFDEYNVAIVQSINPPELNDIQLASKQLTSDIHQFIQRYHEQGKTVAIWGAGGKGLSALAIGDIKQVDLLVDSDPSKQGFYSPITHILVQKPDIEKLNKVDAIIISAMAYRSEIEQLLRTQYKYKGVIAVLRHRLEISMEKK